MNPIYDQIFELDSGIYMTMYNGDTDTVCNFLGDEWFMNDRNLTLKASWREWYYTDTAGQQVGGWTQGMAIYTARLMQIYVKYDTT